MKKLCGLLLALCVVVAGPAWAQTQITTGVIQGTVTDPSGAVVPGAGVEIKNLDTNLTRSLKTDANGRFVALALSPGRYTVTVTQQGFATIVQENLNLTVGQSLDLPLAMKVSATAERIVVTDTPTIETAKIEASTTLNQKTVSFTPILGRKFEDLLTLTPGVSIVQGPDGDEISFNGQRGIFNNISLDGGDYQNGFFGEQFGGQRASIDITLEAVKEFQVIPTGASAEFGRTAGGVVNVITKSGTNEFHGSIFHYQRHESLSSNTSDGKPLTDFHREQFGGTMGGPLVKDKVFLFGAIEQITANLQRDNLSAQIGSTPCTVATPTVAANEALINSNTDCQRLALINFFRTSRNQEEGRPVRRPVHNTAVLAKFDWNVTPRNLFSASYNFDRSNKINETFDVATYGTSANGIEGPSRIQVFNFNLFTTVSPTKLNEGHFTYSREARPRQTVASNVPADTGAGFAPSFRFGFPFFLQPTVDELFWRTHWKDNFSIVWGRHTVKFGGEWIHSNNGQVFRGFFTTRYLFDSVTGFLRYASPTAAGGFGPTTAACSNGTFATLSRGETCASGFTGGPLLFFLQDGIPLGIAGTLPPGASNISNEDFGLFVQDKWQIRPNFTLNYGLRWESQMFPDPVIPPSQTAYGIFLNNARFPSDGTLHNQNKMFQPRIGFAWDVRNNRKSVLRASWGIYNARQNMLTQVGSITTNGAQQRTNFVTTDFIRRFGAPAPVWPNPEPGALFPCAGNAPFPCFTGVRVFSRDYANPRIYHTNVAFEQEIYPDWAFYVDFSMAKGVHLSRFINVNNGDGPPVCCAISNVVQVLIPGTGDAMFYGTSAGVPNPAPFSQLGDVFTAFGNGKSLYRGLTIGMRKRFSHNFQMDWNYTYSKDLDDDSNERDPFTDRTFNRFDLSKDYANADRDQRHRFNFYTYAELPAKFVLNIRMQAHSAQPITPSPRVLNNSDRGRNSIRKNNEFFSWDWRLLRPFRFADRYELIPMIEMFNTTNSDNNVNPLVTPALFNFDGFLRQGVGDPRQVQLALKFTW